MALNEPGISDRDRLTQRLCWAVAITLLITHATLAWLGRLPAVTPASNDDALYLLLAQSLKSFHYVDQHIVGTPGHAQYPPGYPAALALGSMLFGGSLEVAVGLTILFSTLGLLLVFDIARRVAGPVVAVLVLAPLVFSKFLLTYAGRIASEPPYIFFSMAMLWALVCLREGRRQYLIAGAMAILAALTRSIGVSAVAAVVLFWLLQRRFKPALILTVVSALTVGAWLYWTTIAPNQFTERSYAAVATTTAQHFSGPLGLVLTRTINFGKVYIAKSIGSGLDTPTIPDSSVDNAIWLVVILAGAIPGFWAMRKRSLIVPLYFMAYCGILLLYPYKMTRFFIPVIPLVLLATLHGLAVLLRRWSARGGVLVGAAVSLLLVLNSAPGAVNMAQRFKDCDRANATVAISCFDADRLAFFAAARYAKATLPPSAVVLTIKEAAFYYYTGHTVIHPDLAMQRGKNDVPGFIRKKGIEYILVTPFVGGAEIIKVLGPVCDRVELLKDFGNRTILLRLRDSAESIPQNACSNFMNIERQIREQELEDDDDASL